MPKTITPPQISIDQALFDSINDPKEFIISDAITVYANRLTLRDFKKLREIFPQWKTMDPSVLLESEDIDGFEALVAIVWLGIRRHTEDYAEMDPIFDVIHAGNIEKWNETMRYIVGGAEDGTDAEDLPPEKPDPTAEARQGNG